MNDTSRKFGRTIANIALGPNNNKSNLLHPKDQLIKSKRTNDEAVDQDQSKKGRYIENQENNVLNKKDKSSLESHVRKLDLDVPDTTSRVTRSSMIKIKARVSTEGPVDPAILELRRGIDFSDPSTYYRPPKNLPSTIEDFDQTQMSEVASESHYAHDIFLYYKEKELKYIIPNYMPSQVYISKNMRAVLIDWMVEVQESFELNHETLYLAVKMVDHYLSNKVIAKDKFQLLGATCLLMASKYDERIPPSIEDFLYICDDAYVKRDLILMEIEVFKKLNFFLGFPMSYRFLRRFARTGKLSMETLTLSRFILETSLMEYDLIHERDSKMAAGSLLLALKMRGQSWTPDLAFYSGYHESELTSLMYRLNEMISCPVKSATKTIRNKYSHP